MKQHHHERKCKCNKTKQNHHAVFDGDGNQCLEEVAASLDHLARRFLPDNAMDGAYSGSEDDMRQQAILLALSWYLIQRVDPETGTVQEWNAPKAIAGALRIQRREYAKEIKRKSGHLQSMPAGMAKTPHHPSMDRLADLSASKLEAVLRVAINRLLMDRRISPLNAAVALGVLADGIRAADLAHRLGVNRSAIYQHLGRVRRELPHIIDGIEVPLGDFHY